MLLLRVLKAKTDRKKSTRLGKQKRGGQEERSGVREKGEGERERDCSLEELT